MVLFKILKSIGLVVVITTCGHAFSQASSPAQSLRKYVDPFKGDFKYGVPLVTLSGPNGEKFPIALNYAAGIGANQEASWVGLGWSLNIGEIKRQVKGMPDDYRNVEYNKDVITSSSGNWTTADDYRYWGPIWFDQYYTDNITGGQRRMDMYSTNKDMPLGEFPFTFPDYDSYYVSGPGVGGEMRPFIFDYAEYPADPASGANGSYTHYYTAAASGYSSTLRKFTNKPKFRMVNEPMSMVQSWFNKSLTWSGYREADVMNETPYNYPLFPDAANINWYNRDDDQNIFDAANYIEYFTNQQIDNHYDVGGSSAIVGFLDFEIVTGSSDRSTTTKYDPDGIGAFRVATPDGMIYHYALPVYMRDEEIKTFELDDWGSIENVTRYIKDNKYAHTWKLTAITDYRYEDSNNNNYPDDGDKGFWIRIDYTKWSGNYNFRTPYFNYHADASTNRLPFDNSSGNFYHNQGSVTTGNSELYYPETITTATQTAYFIKDVRYDAHGVEDGSNYHTPQLLLKYLVLMDNDDVVDNNIFNSSQTVVESLFSGLSTTCNVSNTLSTEDYDYYQTDIETYALKTVKFEYDYHLAQKNYNNIKTSMTETEKKFGVGTPATEVIYIEGTSPTVTSGQEIYSGKLTLNKVYTYEQNHEQILPEYVFDYTTNNPNFNHERHDIFGFYKDDFDTNTKNRYITSEDDDKVDAWCLNKITTPLGGKIHVTYESDTYTAVGYDGEKGMPYKPTRLFNVSSLNMTGTTNTIGYTWFTVNNSDIDHFYPTASKKYLFIDYNSNDNNCDCGTYFTNSLTGTLTTGGVGTASKITNSVTMCTDLGGYNCDYPTFNSGYVYLIMDEVYGGGIRVKEISLEDPVSTNFYKLNYEYEDGVATTEPDVFGRLNGQKLQRSYASSDRHAMPPSVGYSKIKEVIGTSTSNIGSTEYSFRNMASISMVASDAKTFLHEGATPSYDNIYNLNHFIAMDNKTLYGRINSVTNYDANDNVVSKSTYDYHDYITDPRGMVDEVFYDYYKNHHPSAVSYTYKRMHWKKTFNTHLKKETHFQDGMITSIEYLERDNFTGVPTVTKTITPTASSTTYTEMAYETNTYMGAKTTDEANQEDYANLLLASKEQRIEPALGGSSSEWGNSLITRSWNVTTNEYETTSKTSIWGPNNASTFNGVSGSNFVWKKVEYNSLYAGKNEESIVEKKDMDDGYLAMKYGYDNRFKIAEVNNANYTSFAFSSFESTLEVETGITHFEGEIEKNDAVQKGTIGNIVPHTGNYMIELDNGDIGPMFRSVVNNVTVSGEDFERGIQVGRTYLASVWVHKDSPNDARLILKYDGNSSASVEMRRDNTEGIQIGDWIQLNVVLTVPSTYVSSGGGSFNDVRVYVQNPGTGGKAYFDDLVFHPVDASFTGYVYDERLGLIKATINNENFYTRFEHDNAGNVIEVYKETQNGEKVMSTVDYNFK